MHPNPRIILPVVVFAILATAGWLYYNNSVTREESRILSASGTIEAVEITISPELGGRVAGVYVEEGDRVEAGQVLVQLDTRSLEAQMVQARANLSIARGGLAAAEAALAAAQAAHEAAEAQYQMLFAGPSEAELAVAQSVVDKARIAADAAQEAYDDLTDAARDTSQGRNLKQQLDLALASLDNALAQFDLVKAGARPEQIEASRAQVDAASAQMEAANAQVDIARAQVEAAQAAVSLLELQISNLTLTAPANGVVITRAVHPGEIAAPGAPLLTIGQLDELRITVYVPEDRYGVITLGQPAIVSVDSHPGETFSATVMHIADKAEFTPRNVQTAEGRKTTVFAIKLRVDSADGKLKPGMPADVTFER